MRSRQHLLVFAAILVVASLVAAARAAEPPKPILGLDWDVLPNLDGFSDDLLFRRMTMPLAKFPRGFQSRDLTHPPSPPTSPTSQPQWS